MKKALRKIVLSFLAVVMVAVGSFGILNDNVFADAEVGARAKEFLYATAMYSCFSAYGEQLIDSVTVDNNYKIADLLGNDYSKMKVHIGKWLGDGNGEIDCRTATEKALESKVKYVTKYSIVNGILKGVYDIQGETLKKMRCKYNIVNSNASGWQTNKNGGGDFYWPQGYYTIDGQLDNGAHLGVPPIYIYYGENGYTHYTGGPTDNTDEDKKRIDDSLRTRCDSEKNCEKASTCQNISQFTYVYLDSLGMGVPVMYTTDTNPIGENWKEGSKFNDSYKAVTASSKIQVVVENEAKQTNTGQKTDNAKEQLLRNIKEQFFDYLEPDQYINQSGKMVASKYLIMGRYLFNGDGKFGGGCGGISVLESDANIENLNSMYWDTSLDYIVPNIGIYDSYGIRKKIRIKLGGDSGQDVGANRMILDDLYPIYPKGNEISCSTIANDFSSIEFGSDLSIKKEVYAYAGIIKIKDDDDDVDIPIEVIESSMDCWNAGIDSHAWIMCPAETNLSGFVRAASGAIDTMLVVDSDLYNNNSATHAVWSIVMGAANILMIIILLAIIFSQLTGYGIDNYGIKKMLPKFIMVAVLINLSFLLCEIVVDLSNIVGNGVKELLYSVGGSIISDADVSKMTNFMDYVIPLLYSGLAAGGTIGGIALIVSNGGGALVVFLIILSLLGVVAAIVTFIAMLGARMIIVIMCIALAPLAAACYILPNTQAMYKRWWKAFQAALIIYPLCGAVLGVSYVIKAMVVSAGTEAPFIMYFVAILAPFLPFFMLPTLLKSALSTLGVVGSALTSMGTAFKNGVRGASDAASRGIRDSERFKANQQLHNAARQFRGDEISAKKAQNIHDRLSRRKSLSVGQQDKLKRANDIIMAQRKKEQENLNQTQAGYFEAAMVKQNLDTTEATRDMLMYNNSNYVEALKRKGSNARIEKAAEGNVGVLPVNMELAENRARSRREAQELKNYSDQYSTLTRAEMASRLEEAATAYNSDRNESNALRLQATLAAAEERKMNKEMLGSMSAVSLNASDNNDSKILNQLSGSSNKVLSQYGKQVSKTAANTTTNALGETVSNAANMSLAQFTDGTGRTLDGNIATNINMHTAFANQGNNVLNNMDDDTLMYINHEVDRNSTVPSSAILTPQQLINAAGATTNMKEIEQIKQMMMKQKPEDVQFSGAQLVNAHPDVINEMLKEDSIYRNSQTFKDMMTEAYQAVIKDPSLYSKMDPKVRSEVGRFVGNPNSPIWTP